MADVESDVVSFVLGLCRDVRGALNLDSFVEQLIEKLKSAVGILDGRLYVIGAPASDPGSAGPTASLTIMPRARLFAVEDDTWTTRAIDRAQQALRRGTITTVPFHESLLQTLTGTSATHPPNLVLQVPFGDVKLLELYADAADLRGDLAALMHALLPWLERHVAILGAHDSLDAEHGSTRGSDNEPDMAGFDARAMGLLCHELRAPLFPIIALSDLIISTPADAVQANEIQSHAKMIHAAGQQLLDFITDLNDVARRYDVDFVPQIDVVDLASAADEARHRLSLDAGSPRDPSYRVVIHGEPKRVWTDRRVLDRILASLVRYARECVPDGPASASIHLRAGAKQTVLALKTPKEIPSSTFEPFWRVPAVDRRSTCGGLALAVAKKAASAIGGTLTQRDGGDGAWTEIWIPSSFETSELPHADGGLVELFGHEPSHAFLAMVWLRAHGHSVRFFRQLPDTPVLANERTRALAIVDADVLLDGGKTQSVLDNLRAHGYRRIVVWQRAQKKGDVAQRFEKDLEVIRGPLDEEVLVSIFR